MNFINASDNNVTVGDSIAVTEENVNSKNDTVTSKLFKKRILEDIE